MRKIILWTLVIFIVCGLTALAVQLNIGTEGALPTGAIPVQTPVPGQAFYGWNGISFDTVVMPTPAPTSSPIPASTPVAGQAVTGWGAGTSSVSRESFQSPLPTATPTANYVVRGWNGTSFDTSQLDYSEIANPPSLNFDPAGTAQALITSSTSSPSPTPCTGLQGNFWRKVDSSGTLVDLYQCDCEGADNATNCAWHSNITPVGAGLEVTSDIHTKSSSADFLVSGALTCGASTQGKMQVHTTPLQYCDNAATPTLRYAAYGDSAGKATTAANADTVTTVPYHKCVSVEQLKDTDDNMMIDRAPVAGATITRVSCLCKGTCASTLATFTLHAGGTGGTAMTITDTNPVCGVQGGATGTPKAVTANNVFTDSQDFSFDVTNTPTNNAVDTYEVCLDGTSP